MTIEPGEYMTPPEPGECKHFCSLGCGNLYEFVVVTVTDSTTQFLCVPCFIETAASMLQAVVEPDSAEVQAAVAAYSADAVQAPGKRGKKRSLIGGIDVSDGSEFLDEFEPDVSEAV